MALKINWSDEARDDIRGLDRSAAMFIFDGLLRYAENGIGDVKALQGEFRGRLRLRIGSYRVFISNTGDTIRVHAVKDRKDAYR